MHRTIALLLATALPAGLAAQVDPNIQEFRIRSELLSAFWGRDVFMEAGVVVPPDHDPGRPTPVCYNVHGFGGSHRVAWGRGRVLLEAMREQGYPRMIYVFLDARCPLGHHEFADSVNNGPWGRALTTELIPQLEEVFGGAGAAGRFVTGHSSGGWSSLWLQVTYPDTFNGTWSTAPDPVDFRDFSGIDIYSERSVYHDADGAERTLIRRGDVTVQTFKTFATHEAKYQEYGGQLASFDAVFSPRDEDGRPMQMFDRETGVIDRFVARSWERYDISLILRREWERLGPKLAGKIHVYCGLEDTFRLEGACVLLKSELEQLGSDAEVILVPGRDHGTLFDPHPELWPGGMMERIHREMWMRFTATR